MHGKVALITGAAQGLGRVFTETLVKKGAKVCIADVNSSLGQQTKEKINCDYGDDMTIFTHCDVTSETDLTRTFRETKEKFGQLDIVCNNAGVCHEGEWRNMLDINLIAVIRGTMLGIEHMGKANGGNGGVVVNIASAAGLFAMPFGTVYTASKHGVVGYTRCWAMHPDYEKQEVRVNCMCPTFTDTEILKMTKEHVHNLPMAIAAVQQLGIMQPTDLVDSFLQLVENEELNGAVMRVTPKGSKLK